MVYFINFELKLQIVKRSNFCWKSVEKNHVYITMIDDSQAL